MEVDNQVIVEADETYVLKSRKGERQLDRKARRRGGKVVKRGVSREQVPVLVAAHRGGVTVSAVLPAVSAAALEGALGPVVKTDVVLVSNGAAGYPPCAAALGVRREALNLAADERRLPHSDRQQPACSVEGLSAQLSRRRDQISRQLPALVPPHRTRRPRSPKSLPQHRHEQPIHTLR